MKENLSVVILVKNEEQRISRCLDSIRWADEIIVVDDESTDRTAEVARQYTDKVFTDKKRISRASTETGPIALQKTSGF